MGISEEKIDREQMIEDLHFLSDKGNYKSIKYAIECINKLEQIEQIVDDCDLEAWEVLEKIKEVLEHE